jgi:hypothetical protein
MLMGPALLNAIFGNSAGIKQLASPTTSVGLLDAGVLTLLANGITLAEINEFIRSDAFSARLADLDEISAKSIAKGRALLAAQKAKLAEDRKRIGTEVDHTPKPVASATGIKTPPSVDTLQYEQIVWPTKEN